MCRYTFVGIGVMVAGVVYWAVWRIVIPWMGYDVIPRKEKLKDGTVVSLVRLLSLRIIVICTSILTYLPYLLVVLNEEARVDVFSIPFLGYSFLVTHCID